MVTFTKTGTTDKDYPFVEDLLHISFPEAERRDDEAQRKITDHNPKFSCYLITDGETLAGLITIWKLNGFHYIEHLAISPDLRNHGYGRQTMERVKGIIPGTIILEVEEPNDEQSIRRIDFYRRCGFSICDRAYIQPPYRENGVEVPLKLMYHGTESIEEIYESIRDEIYKEVYGQETNKYTQ